MPTWAKCLVWAGFAGVVSFFGGFVFGRKCGYEAAGEEYEEWITEQRDEAERAIRSYSGADEDGDIEMPLDKPVIDELDDVYEGKELASPPPDPVPQMHGQDILPVVVDEEEYERNIEEYDLENLIFFSEDEVLYDRATDTLIENPDEVVGIGTLMEFGGDPNNPVDILYVRNDTAGTYFRIERLEEAFVDAVDGCCPPEDDFPDEEED